MDQEILVTLTADIVAAHVANNSVSISDMGALVAKVHEALAGLDTPVEDVPQAKVPVVSVRSSVKPDYLVCLECGKKQKTLRRHLQSAHGMTPEEYRGEYDLSASYPMTASNYSEQRRVMAKTIGLGRKKAELAKPVARSRRAPRKPRPRKTD